MKKLAYSVMCTIFLLASSCSPKNKEVEKEEVKVEKEESPKSIILFVGDGNGLSQLSSLWYYQEETPQHQRFTHVGLSKTNSSSHKITDSGAGATAFAIGEKTYNGAIGVASDSTSKETILEKLKKMGYKTGLVATSSITHATPASFFAHVKSRNEHEKIAAQLPKAGVDFIAGGGTGYFVRRTDSLNILNEFNANNYAVDTNSIDNELNGEKLCYLVANKAMPTMLEGRGKFLQTATQKAIDFLSKDGQPFFLVIEGSQVDWAGHANENEYLITEARDFDLAVGLGIDYAQKNGNTLVISVADHETGGFSLSPRIDVAFGGGTRNNYNELDPRYTTDGHTASHVPVMAFGLGAEYFSGIYDNNEIYHKMLKALGLN